MDSARELRIGLTAALPVVIAALPFGLLFGAVAVDNGFSVGEAVLMSAIVYAGASQMVGIELFGERIAPWLIVLSILAVNFRHVLYSAAIGRRIGQWSFLQKTVGFFFLADPQFAFAEQRSEQGTPLSFVWYFGMALGIYLPWVLSSWMGAVFGNAAIDAYSLDLDFLLPIYFLGLVMSFRKRPLWGPVVVVSAVVSVAAYILIGSPWHVSLGAAAGVLLAAVMPPSAISEAT